LFGFKLRRSLAMPSLVMVISGIVWYFDFIVNLQRLENCPCCSCLQVGSKV
jgi:hypothetical protein